MRTVIQRHLLSYRLALVGLPSLGLYFYPDVFTIIPFMLLPAFHESAQLVRFIELSLPGGPSAKWKDGPSRRNSTPESLISPNCEWLTAHCRPLDLA